MSTEKDPVVRVGGPHGESVGNASVYSLNLDGTVNLMFKGHPYFNVPMDKPLLGTCLVAFTEDRKIRVLK